MLEIALFINLRMVDLDTNTLKDMIRAEDKHPWYQSRLSLVKKWGREIAPKSVGLDIGCGSGAAAQLLQKKYCLFPTGMDISQFAVDASRERGVRTLQVDVTKIPISDESQDFALALDVIEHIQDRNVLLSEMYRILKPGGKALITVPAHTWLWSNHDELNHHFRRYSKEMLREDLSTAGFSIKSIRWWNSILLPYIYLTRKSTRKKDSSEFELPPKMLQIIVRIILTTEAKNEVFGKLIGVSLVATIEKPV
jgi:ubiquinone/menaquinone biosynthesis C-methylase UbiE